MLVLVDQGCLSLNLGLGQAWVVLPEAVVLGQVFLRYLVVLGFHFLLSLGDFVDSVLGSCPRYLIGIVRSLHLGLELELVLVQVVGMPSVLERKVSPWLWILMGLQELSQSLLLALFEVKGLKSVVNRSCQDSVLSLSRNKKGYKYYKVKGGKG